MDTNPFANNNQSQVTQPQTPNYLKQDPGNGTMAGGVSNIVKALMDGNNQYKQRQAANAVAPNPATTTGGPSVGAPMSLAPPAPVAPATSAAAVPDASSIWGNPNQFSMGGYAGPNQGVDPATQALFSPIPGVNGG